jgi:hypothetical protein
MRNNIGIILGVVAVLSLALAVSCAPSDTGKSSYAEDRAQIEDLQARYLFALDFFDMDTYVSTFTEDGILDIVVLPSSSVAGMCLRLYEATYYGRIWLQQFSFVQNRT